MVQVVDMRELMGEVVNEVRRVVREEVERIEAPNRKELLTVKEAAEIYGMTPSYWKKQVLHRTIPFVKMGKSVRLKRKDIEEFINDRKIEFES